MSEPKIAVVFTAFRLGGLVQETIESLFAQADAPTFAVVMVNDGCPQPATKRIGEAYAIAYPGSFLYIEQKNQGPSAARNHGITTALGCWPGLEAVFLIDGDDLVQTTTLARAWTALQKNYGTTAPTGFKYGWVFGDQDGISDAPFIRRPPHHPLRQYALNAVGPCALVHADLFRAGLCFDAALLSGFEDWEIWLKAADMGYCGLHIENFGFRYRVRPESRVSGSSTRSAYNANYIKKKYLKKPSDWLTLENNTLPRYTFVLIDEDTCKMGSTLRGPMRAISIRDYFNSFLRDQSHHQPIGASFSDLPTIVVFTTRSFLQELEKLGVGEGVLWNCEMRLSDKRVSIARITHRADADYRISQIDGTELVDQNLQCDLLMVTTGFVARLKHLVGASTFFDYLKSAASERAYATTIEAPADHFRSAEENVVVTAASVIDRMLKTRIPKPYYQDLIDLASDLRSPQELTKKVYDVKAFFPFIPPACKKTVAFIVPVAEFGGVERVIANYAGSLKKLGYSTNLFVLHGTSVLLLQEHKDVFDTITFYVSNEATHSRFLRHYFGAAVNEWMAHGDWSAYIGLLSTFDIVVNANCPQLSPVMGALRQLGTKTYLNLHGHYRTNTGFHTGPTYLGIAYEHVYDGFAVISQKMANWAKGMGVPADKVIIAENCASFEVEHDFKVVSNKNRIARSDGKLRILFMGRFSYEKGIERLAKVVRHTHDQGLDVDWRVVGGKLFGKNDAPLDLTEMYPQYDMSVLFPYLQNYAGTTDEILKHLDWADVLVMTSYFEGVPLIILEAGQLGCPTIAPAVGAIPEIISHEVNGVLIGVEGDETTFESEMTQAIERFVNDSPWRAQVSQNCFDSFSGRSWDDTAKVMADHFELP